MCALTYRAKPDRESVNVQAHWRGARERRAAGKAALVMMRRLRAALAMQADPAKTLAARTGKALISLQQGLQLNQVSPRKSAEACLRL
jgi:hypothetical protein